MANISMVDVLLCMQVVTHRRPADAHAGAIPSGVPVMLQCERPLPTVCISELACGGDPSLLQPSCTSAARWRWPSHRNSNFMGNLSSCLSAGV